MEKVHASDSLVGIKQITVTKEYAEGEDSIGKFRCEWKIRHTEKGEPYAVEIIRNGSPGWEYVGETSTPSALVLIAQSLSLFASAYE